MRFVGVIIGRMDSSRLPGKLLQSLGPGTVLDLVHTRASKSERISGLILATTDRSIDDELEQWADRHDVRACRAATHDVAGRVIRCAKSHGADFVVRLNGDSPFPDPALIDQGIAQSTPTVDMISNLVDRSFPYGISVEVVSVSALERAYPMMDTEDREHVTSLLYRRQDEFTIDPLEARGDGRTDRRLVIDDAEDLKRLRAVARELGDQVFSAGWKDVADTLDALRSRRDHDHT